MSLDVGLQRGNKTDYMLYFEDDGYYWYLYPLFEKMYESIGIYIDLYGDAQFNTDTISHLESLISEASKLISKEPDCWDVHIGTQTHPQKKELYSKVSKSEFKKKLAVLSAMVSEVKTANLRLLFRGD